MDGHNNKTGGRAQQQNPWTGATTKPLDGRNNKTGGRAQQLNRWTGATTKHMPVTILLLKLHHKNKLLRVQI